jgi:prepilin-type processing-associated H-X9-DG protein
VPTGYGSGFDFAEYVKEAKISDVPDWIWVIGENWGQDNSSVYSYPTGLTGEQGTFGVFDPANGSGADASWDTVGQWSSCILDGEAARFHDVSTAFSSASAGGNYGYPDGHVEFVRYADIRLVRNLGPPGGGGTNSYGVAWNNNTVYGNHWYWWTTK